MVGAVDGDLAPDVDRGDAELPADFPLGRISRRNRQALLDEVPIRQIPDRNLFLVLDLENALRGGEVPVAVVRLEPQPGAGPHRSLPQLPVPVHQAEGVVIQIDHHVDPRRLLEKLFGRLGELAQGRLPGADGIHSNMGFRLRPR